MDPNTALANARQAIDDYENAGSLGMESDAAEQLIEAFRALDGWLSKDGFLPTDWQADEDKPVLPIDPWQHYQMYTPEGNEAVGQMVQRVIADSQRLNCQRPAVIDAMRNGIREVGKVHPEVRDTEPRGAIYDALDRYFDVQGWDRIEDGSL